MSSKKNSECRPCPSHEDEAMYAVVALITLTILTWAIAIWATFDAEDEAQGNEAPSNMEQLEAEDVKKVA